MKRRYTHLAICSAFVVPEREALLTAALTGSRGSTFRLEFPP